MKDTERKELEILLDNYRLAVLESNERQALIAFVGRLTVESEAMRALDVAVKALEAVKAAALKEIKTPLGYDTRLTATCALMEMQTILTEPQPPETTAS